MSSAIGDAWEVAALDPDLHTDLGYKCRPLTVIELSEMKGGKYMILPGVEDHLEDEEFMIVDPGSICRLDECR